MIPASGKSGIDQAPATKCGMTNGLLPSFWPSLLEKIGFVRELRLLSIKKYGAQAAAISGGLLPLRHSQSRQSLANGSNGVPLYRPIPPRRRRWLSIPFRRPAGLVRVQAERRLHSGVVGAIGRQGHALAEPGIPTPPRAHLSRMPATPGQPVVHGGVGLLAMLASSFEAAAGRPGDAQVGAEGRA